MSTLTLQPDVLSWARRRAGLSIAMLAKKLGAKAERVEQWEVDGKLTFKQAEKLAHHTSTPFGFLFLPKPVKETLGLVDFRTRPGREVTTASPELLDTVRAMQRRVDWMREHLVESGQERLPFVGAHAMNAGVEKVVLSMRDTLGLTEEWTRESAGWQQALRQLRAHADAVGILVVVNGVVGNNTNRALSVDEFRGFAIADPWAPLIFINGADAKSAQMFTMAHELAHLWLGQSGVSNLVELQPGDHRIERFCNAAAAEFLVPAKALQKCWPQALQDSDPFRFLARHFKVSPIVAARRALDLSLISRQEFSDFYRQHTQKSRSASSGGDFWNTQRLRVGDRFGSAVVNAAREGRLLYRDAYQLTDMKAKTFHDYAKYL